MFYNGYDFIEGGRYADTLYNSGNDRINGGSGNDQIVGGDGDDLMDGQSGEDTIVLAGNSSNYSIESSEYIDHLYGYGAMDIAAILKAVFTTSTAQVDQPISLKILNGCSLPISASRLVN